MTVERMLGNNRMSGVVKCGDLVYLSGLTGTGETMTEQAKDVLSKIEERLAAAGSDKDHVLRATIFIKDMSLFEEMNAVWDAWVNPETAPVRACVQAQLARETVLIEIVIDAVVK